MRAVIKIRKRQDNQLHSARRRVRADELPVEHPSKTFDLGGVHSREPLGKPDRVYAQGMEFARLERANADKILGQSTV